MPPKINTELWEECKTAAQTEPQREIPVLQTGHVARKLKDKGRRVNHSFESISAVAGTLTCVEVKAVAQLTHVERIEFDGEENTFGQK